MQGLDSVGKVEHVSSLMDGELEAEAAVRAIARLKLAEPDTAQRESWDAYHLIGDVMRDGAAGAPALSAGFQARFSARLADEPTVLAPQATPLKRKSRLQTYALSAAAAASVAAVAVVGWMALSATQSEPVPGGAGVLAAAPTSPQPVAALPPQIAASLVAAAKSPGVMAGATAASDPAPEHAHEYLLAHQGISPTTAFQGVAPYIRTVSAAAD